MHETLNLLAGFTAPIYIGTNPLAMLWMFPLLASVALVYKATKLRVFHWKRYWKEVGILFVTLSGFMIMAAIALNLLVWVIT
jgi:hypothetical protein